ncbi:MAG: DUF1552 domain-containing protein [Proteobacteria bacterium]|nr:MAG: DUF1552 domain-containing protein [Pseudomonadota bacterium]
MSHKKILAEIDRRNLLKYLGNAALFAPFMRTLLETQAFGAVNAKRSLFFYYPDGIVPAQFHPSTMGSNYDLKTITKPLAALREDIVLITNSNYGALGDAALSHQYGAGYSLTAVTDRRATISIDSYLGSKFKSGVSLPVLRLGAGASFQKPEANRSVSLLSRDQVSPVEDNPKQAFAAVFGSSPSTPSTTPSALTSLGAKGEKSVLDSTLSDLKALQLRLGSIEKAKLDLHVESVRELERRTQIAIDRENGAPSGAGNASCIRVNEAAQNFKDSELVDDKAYNTTCDIQIDIAVQALACGITNVVLFQMSHALSPVFMDFPGGPNISRYHHDCSHVGGDEYSKCQAYFIGKYAQILSGMKAIKEGDKNLLFNSVTLSVTDVGDSNSHSMNNVGIIVGGQAGGRVKTGQALDAKGASHGQTLVSILQAMGIQENSFGEATGVMPGLLI